MKDESVVSFRDVWLAFDRPILRGVSFSVRRGEFMTLLGPSGCGKITPLRIIAGFEQPDSGRVLLNGEDVTLQAPYERDVHTTLTYRLSYSPLTRQYRLARGGLSQPFDSAEEALALVKSVRNWKVADKSQLAPRDDYDAQVRMRLDVSQLPKPFQVNAITSREWNLASDWREIQVTADLLR